MPHAIGGESFEKSPSTQHVRRLEEAHALE